MTHKKITLIALITLILFAGWQVYSSQSSDKNNEALKQEESSAVNSYTPEIVPPINLVGSYDKPISVGNAKLNVEVASTTAAQTQGLSHREQLTDTQGMLFDLRSRPIGKPTFWMKDMKFDLDIIWIKDFKVVDISKNVPKPDPLVSPNELPKYSPKENADMVLEVNSGWSDENKIKVGDKITL